MRISPFNRLQCLNPLTRTWLVLMVLTLLSVVVAEQQTAGAIMVLLVCGSFAVKGALVTERLMGLCSADGNIRWLMLCYFIVLPVLVGTAILFPGLVERMTTL